MLALAFNFFKRAVLVPAAVLALVLAALTVVFPQRVARSAQQVNTVYAGSVSLSSFNTVEYDSFSALPEDALVGTLESDDLEMPAVAVLYGTENRSNIGMAALSSEPWGDNGGLLLLGENTYNQLKYLHRAAEGDVFTFRFYGREAYRYAVEEIIAGCTESDLASYCEEGKLVMCFTYPDLSNENEDKLYFVCVAGEVTA